MLRRLNMQDLLSAALFIAFGLGAILVAPDYGLGTAARMSAGSYPFGIGICLTVLGVAIGVKAVISAEPSAVEFVPKPVILILGAVLVFAYGVDSIGLIIASAASVMVASLADHDFRLKQAITTMVLLIAGVVAVFYFGLRMPFKLWWF